MINWERETDRQMKRERDRKEKIVEREIKREKKEKSNRYFKNGRGVCCRPLIPAI